MNRAPTPASPRERTPIARSVPVGTATELPLSALTREEYDSLFGEQYEATQPADLDEIYA
jgi:hypothetical protein